MKYNCISIHKDLFSIFICQNVKRQTCADGWCNGCFCSPLCYSSEILKNRSECSLVRWCTVTLPTQVRPSIRYGPKIIFTETTFYLNYKCVLLDSLLRYCLMVDRGPVGPLLDGRLPIVESEMLSAESVYILCHSLAMK